MVKTTRRCALFAVAPVACFVLAEIVLRLVGALDFPIYRADNVIGYIPEPTQQGSYLHWHTWRVNSLSMGAGEFKPNPDLPNVLLIGDSLVWGGNQYREQDRLGPRLADITRLPVWPASAPSWALRNELTYLRLHPEVVRAVDAVIFVVNNGDFDAPSSWACDLTHPRDGPTLATVYLFRKFIWGHCDPVRPDMQVSSGDWRKEMLAFTSSPEVKGKTIIVFLYPDREEAATPELIATHLESHIPELRASGVQNIISIGRDHRWNAALYKDKIHPTSSANRVLASIISGTLENALHDQNRKHIDVPAAIRVDCAACYSLDVRQHVGADRSRHAMR